MAKLLCKIPYITYTISIKTLSYRLNKLGLNCERIESSSVTNNTSYFPWMSNQMSY